MLYSDYLYSSSDRSRVDILEENPKHIKYLLNRHNLKYLYYGDSSSNFLNLQKLKKGHLSQLQTIFENSHNCLIDFKYFGYTFLIESSMIEKIPLLEKYYLGSGDLEPNYFIYNLQNKLFYYHNKIKGNQLGCTLIVIDIPIDLPFINLIYQVPKIIKFTSMNGCLYDNFLEIIYNNLQYEYTKEETVSKSLIFKYLQGLISFFGITIISDQSTGENID